MLTLVSTILFSQNHSFTYSSPICANGINPAPATSANFVSGGTFLGTAGLSLNASTGLINLATSTPGTYTVTYTGAICSCFTNAPVSATIQILTLPSINILGTNTICSGSALNLTATGASNYTWSTGAFTSTMTDFPFNPVTSYTVLGANSNGCTNLAVQSVTTIATPTVSISANASVCVGYNYTMAAVSPGPATYTWSGTSPIVGNTAIVSATLLTSATFSVIVSVGGCTAVALHGVAVVPIPTINIVGSTSVCAGNRITLFAQGGATYTWNTGENTDTLGIQPVLAATYTVYGTDLNGCTSSKVHSVQVLPKPNVSIVGGNALCSGKTLPLSASGAISYTWTTGIQALGINVSAVADTTIWLTGRNQQGCTNTASIHIIVSPSPTIAVSNVTTCAGQAATLVVIPDASQAGNLSYLWVPGSITGDTYMPVPPVTTNYTVTATLGPCFTRAVATVSVLPNTFPFVAFSYPQPLCAGAAPVYPVLSGSFTTGGVFSTSSGIALDPQSGLLNVTSSAEGLYTVQYSVEPQGCRTGGFSSTFIQIKPQIKITLDSDYHAIGPGESVILAATGSLTSFEWTPSQYLSCASCKAPVATPPETQVYCVRSSEDCVVGACVKVEVICERKGDFSVPTAFTPNRDGLNDKYCLKGWDECNKAFNIKIFDRWGELIFESNDPNFCWDGTFNGKDLPTGTFVYMINADFDRVPAYRQSGNISLIR